LIRETTVELTLQIRDAAAHPAGILVLFSGHRTPASARQSCHQDEAPAVYYVTEIDVTNPDAKGRPVDAPNQRRWSVGHQCHPA